MGIDALREVLGLGDQASAAVCFQALVDDPANANARPAHNGRYYLRVPVPVLPADAGNNARASHRLAEELNLLNEEPALPPPAPTACKLFSAQICAQVDAANTDSQQQQ